MDNQTFNTTFNSTINSEEPYNPWNDPLSSESTFFTYLMHFSAIPILSFISIFVMPIETASVRWYTEYRPKIKIDNNESEITSFYQMLKHIKRKEGISGYYKGILYSCYNAI